MESLFSANTQRVSDQDHAPADAVTDTTPTNQV